MSSKYRLVPILVFFGVMACNSELYGIGKRKTGIYIQR